MHLASLRCFLITVPLENGDEGMSEAMTATIVQQTSGNDDWNLRCGSSSSAFFGDRVHAQRWIAFGVRAEVRGLRPTFPLIMCEPSPFATCIDSSMNHRSEFSFPVAMDQRMWNGPWSHPSDVDVDYFLP